MAKKTNTSSPGFPGQYGILAQQLNQGFGGQPASFTPAGAGLLNDPKAVNGLLDFQNYVNGLYGYEDPRLEPNKPKPKPEPDTPVDKPTVKPVVRKPNDWIASQKFGQR